MPARCEVIGCENATNLIRIPGGSTNSVGTNTTKVTATPNSKQTKRKIDREKHKQIKNENTLIWRKMLINRLKRKDEKSISYDGRICRSHFHPRCFLLDNDYNITQTLRDASLPSINLKNKENKNNHINIKQCAPSGYVWTEKAIADWNEQERLWDHVMEAFKSPDQDIPKVTIQRLKDFHSLLLTLETDSIEGNNTESTVSKKGSTASTPQKQTWAEKGFDDFRGTTPYEMRKVKREKKMKEQMDNQEKAQQQKALADDICNTLNLKSYLNKLKKD